MSIRDSKEKYNKYMRKYHINRYYALKEEAIKSLGGTCRVCGGSNDLQIDHKDPKTKEFSVTRILTFSKERLQKELKKCQVLCKDHHNEKTLRECGKKVAKGTHGTVSSYRYCHCESCRKAHNEYVKNWKKNKRADVA